jgi:hypothetical protein
MGTVVIGLKNEKVLKLLQDLKEMHLIRLVYFQAEGTYKKLSEKYAGRLSSKVAEEMQEYIVKSREEWDKNI